MSSAPNTIPTPTTSDPHFDSALAEYSMHTGYDLLSHPRTTAIDQCGSLGSVLDMFREQSRAFDEFRHRDPELVKWLEPIVTKLHVIRTSAALRAAGATLAFPPDKYILYGIGVLLSTDKYARKSYDILSKLFKCIESFLQRLQDCSRIQSTPAITEMVIRMLAELLTALAVTTKQINQTRFREVVGWLQVYERAEQPIQRLERLSHEEYTRIVLLPMALASLSRLSLLPTMSLFVHSETVLGYGSHGTVVFEGSFQDRTVAVKRLLREYVNGEREVSLLKDAYHPNVIRCFYHEFDRSFLYIVLELCPASLVDIIEQRDRFRTIADSFNPKRAVRDITSGLKYLHTLRVVHRDIKPSNILVSYANEGESSGYRMLISDFGLCRKLDLEQSSFSPTEGSVFGGGTCGWKAPEILRGEVKADETIADDDDRTTIGTGTQTMRLTKSVDIFALGCLYYYCLTSGGHPFGDRYEREYNILRDQKSLEGLEDLREDGPEAVDLIVSMLASEASKRPNATKCLLHPYFWEPGRRLEFLQEASDRFEPLRRNSQDPILAMLERNAANIVGHDWSEKLDEIFLKHVEKRRNKQLVQDLLRVVRNQDKSWF